MVKCPWCRQEIPIEEYSRHYDRCYKGMPPEKEFERTQLINRLREAVSKLPAFHIKWTDVEQMSTSELREVVEHIEEQVRGSSPEEKEKLKRPPDLESIKSQIAYLDDVYVFDKDAFHTINLVVSLAYDLGKLYHFEPTFTEKVMDYLFQIAKFVSQDNWNEAKRYSKELKEKIK